MKHRWMAIATLMLAAGTLAGCPLFPRTVDFVDLERYTGLWYQVAGYPFGPSDGLVGITAEYTLLDDGRIRVVNAGFEGDFDGPIDSIEGTATVVDTRTNARLAVGFGPFSFNRAVLGNYWIIDLDTEDYQWAVVSDPLRFTLFILQRDPVLDADHFADLLERLGERGFNIGRIELFEQQVKRVAE